MSYMTKKAIMERMKEHYDEANKKGELFGIFLQGSQNYIDDMFFEGSDVDSRAIYLPGKKEICLGKDISKPEMILDNEEHIDRFDIRKFVGLLKKPGINNYEALFTEYYVINDKYKEFYEELVKLRERIVRANEKGFLMATMGISMRDFKALQKRSGGEDHDIEKYGYSRKRLSNIMRFNATAVAYANGEDFLSCLRAMDQELIHKVRRTEFYSLDEALSIAEKCDKKTHELAKDFKDDSDDSALDELDDLIVELLSTRFQ